MENSSHESLHPGGRSLCIPAGGRYEASSDRNPREFGAGTGNWSEMTLGRNGKTFYCALGAGTKAVPPFGLCTDSRTRYGRIVINSSASSVCLFVTVVPAPRMGS